MTEPIDIFKTKSFYRKQWDPVADEMRLRFEQNTWKLNAWEHKGWIYATNVTDLVSLDHHIVSEDQKDFVEECDRRWAQWQMDNMV